MNIDNINAIVTINNAVQPLQRLENKGLARYERDNSTRDGIIYVGYHANYRNNTYPPPGKETKGIVEPGGILDIYV